MQTLVIVHSDFGIQYYKSDSNLSEYCGVTLNAGKEPKREEVLNMALVEVCEEIELSEFKELRKTVPNLIVAGMLI